MADRREFLAAAAAFAAGAAISEGTAAAASSHLVTILNGDGPPPRHLGVIGDFYIDDRAHTIYGPREKTGWRKPTSLVGPRGYSVLHGSRPPAASAGIDNDFYIDTATTQLYGPKHGGVWGSPVSLTGTGHIPIPQDAAYVLSIVGSGVGAINTKTGNTDYSVSSGDHAPVVQKAVNNLLSASGPTRGLGGKIAFDGHLQFATQLVLYPNIALVGAGMHGYQVGSNSYGSLITSSYAGPCILITNDDRGSTFVALSRFQLYGAGENSGLTGQHGIVWQPGSGGAGNVLDTIIEQVGVFHMGGDGFQLNGAQTGNQLKVLAEQCFCEFCGGNAVTLNNQIGLWWSGGYVLAGGGGAFVSSHGASGILSISNSNIGAGTGVVPLQSGYTALVNNTLHSNGVAINHAGIEPLLIANNLFTSCPNGAVILTSVSNDVSIVDNVFDANGSPSAPQLAVQAVTTTAHNILVEGNDFLDPRGTGAVTNHIALSTNNLNAAVTGNTFRGQQGDAITWRADHSSHLLIKNNRGYNDIKAKIATPFSEAGGGSTVGAAGTTATPTASTAYTVEGTDLMLSVSGGTGVSITIIDPAGHTVQSGLTSYSGVLPVGYAINIGAFTAAPTVYAGVI